MTTTATLPNVEIAPISFEAQGIGWQNKQKWTIQLLPEGVEFSSAPGQVFCLLREQGHGALQFANAFVSGYNLAVKYEGKTYKFKLAQGNVRRLQAWLPRHMLAAMKAELRSWGVGLILLGMAHFVWSDWLDPTWGGIILVIGCLNLFVQQRGMFIVNGLVLLLVGVLNISGAASERWMIFGVFQLLWGLQELWKFKLYACTLPQTGEVLTSTTEDKI